MLGRWPAQCHHLFETEKLTDLSVTLGDLDVDIGINLTQCEGTSYLILRRFLSMLGGNSIDAKVQ